MKFRGLFLFSLISLQACGFQLRGFDKLPDHIRQMTLVADSFTVSQQQRLTEQLQRAGAILHRDGGDGVVKLQVSIQALPDQRLVDSVGSGQNIMKLSKQLNYSLVDASGDPLASDKTLSAKLELELDDDNLLGNEKEKWITRENLDDLLFNRLLRQLRQF